MSVTEGASTIRTPMSESEFLRLPGDGRKYELVNGEAKEVPTRFEHDTIVVHLITLLPPHARGRGFLAGSQAGFRMKDGNIRCPDLSFTRKARLPGGRPPREILGFAPDLAIEVISPSEDRRDMARKVEEYFDAGAEQVWQLFPEVRQLRLFRSLGDAEVLTAEAELDGGELLPGFRCTVGELFELE